MRLLAVDTETTGLHYWEGEYPFIITAADEFGRAFFARLDPAAYPTSDGLDSSYARVIPKGGPLPAELPWLVKNEIPGLDTMEEFKDALRRDHIIMHNAKFDTPMLEYAGFEVNRKQLEDTMILARLVIPDSPRISLKFLARALLKVDYASETRLKEWMRTNKTKNFAAAPMSLLVPYATDDAIYTMALYRGLRPKVPDTMTQLYDNEMKLMQVIIDMESRGMWCDLEYADEKAKQCRAYQAECQALLNEMNGGVININSTKQLREFLFDRLKLGDTLSHEERRRYATILRTPKGDYSTKREVLRIYDHPAIEAIMEYRMFGKMAGTYFEKFLELADRSAGGVIHPSFWQCGTRTGRFSSSDPSFQTIPSVSSGRLLDFDRGRIPDVRHCFGARPGYTLYAPDFSQIELRLAAWAAGDEVMIRAFTEDRDIHDETTKAIFPDDWMDANDPTKVDKPKRTFCKMVNFGILYGMGLGKLSSDLGVPVDRGREFINRYFATYPGLHTLMLECQRSIVTKGYVESVFGRRAKASPQESYKGLNYLIQGTAADVMKTTMLRIYGMFVRYNYDAFLLNTVHDEVLFEIRTGQDDELFHQRLRKAMTDWPQFAPVPFPVDCKRAIDRWGNHESVWKG